MRSLRLARLTAPVLLFSGTVECVEEKPRRWIWNATCNANQPNEDTMSSRQSVGIEGNLFSVCDGHGGPEVSTFEQIPLTESPTLILIEGLGPGQATAPAVDRCGTRTFLESRTCDA